jgi:hypothetical protein
MAVSAIAGLVHSLLTELCSAAKGRGTSGRGISGRLLPPGNSLSSCWVTSTSGVFVAASVCRRIVTVGQGFCGISSPKSSSPLRGSVSAVRGHATGSVVRGWVADTGGFGGEVCSGIVLATGPHNPPAVRALTGGSVWFSSRPDQEQNPLCHGRVDTRTGHKPMVFRLGWTHTTVPFSGFCNFGSN